MRAIRWSQLITVALCASWPGAVALAQEDPTQLTEEVVDEAPDENTTSWTLSAGGVLSTGNTESLQANAATDLSLIRGHHGFGLTAQYILGRAGDNFDDETADNLRARARYDFFFTRMDAAFLAVAVRRDPFAGLAPRVQGQIGYLRNFLKNEDGDHRAWGEFGYDLTYDRFDYDLLDIDPAIDPATLPDDQVVHAGRIFLGYDNHMNEDLTYKTGLEALFNVEDLGDFRLSWDNALSTRIGGNLQAELKVSLQLDTDPVAGAEKLDTTTTLNLIYTLLTDEEDEEGEGE